MQIKEIGDLKQINNVPTLEVFSALLFKLDHLN